MEEEFERNIIVTIQSRSQDFNNYTLTKVHVNASDEIITINILLEFIGL